MSNINIKSDMGGGNPLKIIRIGGNDRGVDRRCINNQRADCI